MTKDVQTGLRRVAMDIYGKGVRPKDNQEAAVEAGSGEMGPLTHKSHKSCSPK